VESSKQEADATALDIADGLRAGANETILQ
jgi:hypothetical protein